MKRFVLILLVCLIAVPAMAQDSKVPKWFTLSTITHISDGRNQGDLWYDVGVAMCPGISLGSAEIGLLWRYVEVEGESPTTALSGLIIEPLAPWIDLMFEIGAGSRIVLDEDNGDRDYGVISGVALNLHKPSGVTNVFFGIKVYQDTPGKVDAIGYSAGAALVMDPAVDWLLNEIKPGE
jgi:hypothetical protein